MQDALLRRTLRLTVVGTIALVSMISLILLYRVLFDVIWGDWPEAISNGGWGALAMTASILLIRFRGDLIDT